MSPWSKHTLHIYGDPASSNVIGRTSNFETNNSKPQAQMKTPVLTRDSVIAAWLTSLYLRVNERQNVDKEEVNRAEPRKAKGGMLCSDSGRNTHKT